MADQTPNSTTASNQTRIMVWTVPRARSTILTKCLSFLPDSEVIFEPYCYSYHAAAFLKSIGKEDIVFSDQSNEGAWRHAAEMIAQEDCSGERVQTDMLRYPAVKRMMDNPRPDKKVIIMKDVTYAIDGLYEYLPDKSSNYKFVFLIRHPAPMFKSWRKVMFDEMNNYSQSEKFLTMDNFDMNKTVPVQYPSRIAFYKETYDLWNFVKKTYAVNPVVIDSDDLVANPDRILSKFCAAMDIPYNTRLVKWQESPDSTDTWQNAFMPMRTFKLFEVFCKTALNTSHFISTASTPKVEDMTPDIQECVKISMPYYNELYNARIVP